MSGEYTWWDKEVIDQFLEDVATCTTTTDALAKNDLSKSHFYRMLHEDEAFNKKYREAVSLRANAAEERLFELVPETKDVKLLQFILRSHMPKVYGDIRNKDEGHLSPPIGEPG